MKTSMFALTNETIANDRAKFECEVYALVKMLSWPDSEQWFEEKKSKIDKVNVMLVKLVNEGNSFSMWKHAALIKARDTIKAR